MKNPRLNEEQKDYINKAIRQSISFQKFAWQNQDTMSDQDSETFNTEYNRLLSLVKGTYWVQRNEMAAMNNVYPRRSSNQILPKLVAKNSIMTAGKTEFNCEALKPEFEELAPEVSTLLTSEWQKFGYDRICERALWDINIYRFGIVEVGWRFQRKYERLEGERGEASVPTDAIPLDIAGENPYQPQEFGSEEEAKTAAYIGNQAEEEMLWGDVEIDDHFVERFRPTHFLVDPNATSWDLSDAQYAFRVKYETIESIKNNPKYSKTSDLKGTVYVIRDDDNHDYDANPRSNNEIGGRARVKLYDGYVFLDLDKDGIDEFYHVIVADENKEIILFTESPYIDDKGKPIFSSTGNPFPYRVIPGIIIDNDVFYPESPVYQAEDLQKAYDESWSALNDRRRKSTVTYVVPRGMLDEDIKRQLESGKDRLVIEVPTDKENPLQVLESPSGSADFYKSLDNEPQEISRQLGINEFQESILPQKDVLAREVMLLNEAGGVRTSGDNEKFNAFKEDVATCLLALMQTFADRGRTYSKTSAEGKKLWGTLNSEDLNGYTATGEPNLPGVQYKVLVNAESSMPKNKSYDLDLASKVIQVLAPFAQMQDPTTGQPIVNIKAVLRDFLTSAGKKNTDAYISPEPTPEEKAQIEAQNRSPQKLMEAMNLIDSFPPQVVAQIRAQYEQMKAQGGAPTAPAQQNTGTPPATGEGAIPQNG